MSDSDAFLPNPKKAPIVSASENNQGIESPSVKFYFGGKSSTS